MHSTRICPAFMRLRCCWRCSCTTNLKKLSAIACAVSLLKVTSCVASSFFLNRFFGSLAGSDAADAPFPVTPAAFARFFDGSANSIRCFTATPSDANARSLSARSSAVPTSSQEELAPSSLCCCSLLRSTMNYCSCLYVYGAISLGTLNVP